MRRLLAIISVGLLTCFASVSRSDTVLTNFVSDPGITSSGTIGYSFTVGLSPVFVTALGVFDANGLGFVDPHMVGIWSDAGTNLGTVTVPAGITAPLEDGYRYVDLPGAIMLAANQTYVLGAGYGPNPEVIGGIAGTVTAHSPFVGNIIARLGGPGFTFPATGTEPGAFLGPNARFFVPEPSTVALGIAALVVCSAAALRRKLKSRNGP